MKTLHFDILFYLLFKNLLSDLNLFGKMPINYINHNWGLLKNYFIYLFLERGREGERGEKHQYMAASHAPPVGDLACNPDMYPDWELNW